MPILLQPLAHRRYSRRRVRSLRARMAVVAASLLVIVYLLWHPTPWRAGVPTKADIAPTSPSIQRTPTISDGEPEQSIDTEGALSGWQEASDATFYVADR